MKEIKTKQNLSDVLNYSAVRYSCGEGFSHTIVRFNEPEIVIYRLLTIAISDINENLFDAYKDGHLKICHNGEGISFSELKEVANQQMWLKGLTGNIRKSDLAFSIYEGADTNQSLGLFYACNEKDKDYFYPAVNMFVNSGHKMFKKDRVKVILSPFIKKDKLDELVEKIIKVK